MRIVVMRSICALFFLCHLATAQRPPGRLFDDALPSPHALGARTFDGVRRRLAATPYGPSPSRLPRFAYRGGPPDAAGAWASLNSVNFQSASGFVTSVYLGDGEPAFQQQMGRFQTWECAGGVRGRYVATTLRADTYQNGTVVVEPHCEVGQVDLEKGLYFWTATAGGCPDPATVKFRAPSRRIASKTFPAAAKYVCTGEEGLGVDAPAGGPGLAPSVRAGTRNAGTSLPPPLDPAAAFPPVFDRQDGPGDLTGVWFSDAFATGELAAPDGAVASVGLRPDGSYWSVLVRLDSYSCVPGSPGAYKAAVSFTQTFENLTTVSGTGCSSGTVELGREGRYLWTPASDASCPPLGADPLFAMDRVLESAVLATPAQLSCK